MAAMVPFPSNLFSPESMEYSAERGRDFWDTFIQVAFMFGWHNGSVMRDSSQAKTNEMNNSFIEGAEKAIENNDMELALKYLESLKKLNS